MCLALTWSKSAGVSGEVRAYYSGSQTGATQVALGVWAGPLAAGVTVIGAFSTAPILLWSGFLAHCAIWRRALSATQVARLATVH